MLPSIPELAPRERDDVERDLEDFLAAQIFAMPSFLLGPFLVVLFTFNFLPLARYRRTYVALAEAMKRRILLDWSNSRVGPKRDFVKLIRSCAVFYYLDHPLVRNRLEMTEHESSARSDVSQIS